MSVSSDTPLSLPVRDVCNVKNERNILSAHFAKLFQHTFFPMFDVILLKRIEIYCLHHQEISPAISFYPGVHSASFGDRASGLDAEPKRSDYHCSVNSQVESGRRVEL